VGGPDWTSASIQIQNAAGTVVHSDTMSGAPISGAYDFPDWNVASTGIPDGIYTVTASATVNNSCRATAGPRSFQIESSACGQRIVNAAFGGTGVTFAQTMNFQIENSCPDIVRFNQFNSIWANVRSTIRLTNLSAGSTVYYDNSTGVASNQSMPFSQTLSLAAGTVFAPSTSAVLTFTFNNNFTSNGSQNGSVGRFTSIVAKVINPTFTDEQLVDGATSIP